MERKTILWTLQATNKQNLLRKNLEMVRKANLKKETESLRTAAQNNAIRTKYIKARIEKTRQNSKCRLCSDRDETIKHRRSDQVKVNKKRELAK